MLLSINRFCRFESGYFTLWDIDNKFSCFGMSSINSRPKGLYRLDFVYSEKFHAQYGHDMIWIHPTNERLYTNDNAFRSLIHAGNTFEDTEGCEMCGMGLSVSTDKNLMSKPFLGSSRAAYDIIHDYLKDFIHRGMALCEIYETYHGGDGLVSPWKWTIPPVVYKQETLSLGVKGEKSLI